MAKEITIQLTRKQAEELADISLKCGFITEDEYESKVEYYMKPSKALFG